MLTFIAFVHIVVAIFLIVLVLLQDSKGGAMGMLGGGGGSSSLFGSTGASSFLVKATRWTAVVFAVTCIYLAYKTAQPGGSVLDQVAPAATPVEAMSEAPQTAPDSTDPQSQGSDKAPSQ